MEHTIDKYSVYSTIAWSDNDSYTYMSVLYHIRVVEWAYVSYMSSQMEDLA